MAKIPITRGDIVEVDLRGSLGAEKANDATSGARPCLVVQNNGGNGGSPLTIVVPLTDSSAWKNYSQQVQIAAAQLPASLKTRKDSVAECGHIRTIDRDQRIHVNFGPVDPAVMPLIDAALKASLALP